MPPILNLPAIRRRQEAETAKAAPVAEVIPAPAVEVEATPAKPKRKPPAKKGKAKK